MSHRTTDSRPSASALGLLLCLAAQAAGCGSLVETRYGGSRGTSVNGTGALAELVRRREKEVWAARRLTAELAGWADCVVRFAWTPGPIGKEEAQWYEDWLAAAPGRSLVYVVRDYDAEADYWSAIEASYSGPADEALRAMARERREAAADWAGKLPPRATDPADAKTWFKTGSPRVPPSACKSLAGPWADATEIDANSAALTLHEPLIATKERVLLSGDGQALVMEWAFEGNGRVLAIANGSFLLNYALVNAARRPLAELVVAWIGEQSQRVAFVEGTGVVGPPARQPTLLDLVRDVPAIRWAAVHLGIFGLLACLARASGLGRARTRHDSGAKRPAAHAEALGALLARSRSPETAREILQTYGRWRQVRSAFAPPGGLRTERS